MREKLIELLMDMPSGNSTYEEEERRMEAVADYMIANGVTIPVWCKDCKYKRHNKHHDVILCDHQNGRRHLLNPMDFCSDGERGEENV